MNDERKSFLKSLFGWSLVVCIAVGLIVSSGLIPDNLGQALPFWLKLVFSLVGLLVAALMIAGALRLLCERFSNKNEKK